MKLQQLSEGTRFKYDGCIYEIDPHGRSGGGKVAVYNVYTNEQKTLHAMTEVDLVIEGYDSETTLTQDDQEEDGDYPWDDPVQRKEILENGWNVDSVDDEWDEDPDLNEDDE